jgi:hypothetical protein
VLVDEDDYTRGLSLSRLAYDLESLLSPMLAAALLVVMSYQHLFVGTVIGFALSTVLVLTTTVPIVREHQPAETVWQRTTLGARAMMGRPVLQALLALNLVVATATALVAVNTVVYVNDVLHASNSGLAVMLACYGAGSMVVALSVPRLLTAATDWDVPDQHPLGSAPTLRVDPVDAARGVHRAVLVCPSTERRSPNHSSQWRPPSDVRPCATPGW